jgi:hypothetical protein
VVWTAPITAIAGATVTSADFNTYVRDNLLQTMPAKAAEIGSMFATSGSNAIAERIPSTDFVSTSETTASTTYTDLATTGPSVSVITGTQAIIVHGARCGGNTNTAGNPSTKMSWSCSGATTINAASASGSFTQQGDQWACGMGQQQSGVSNAYYTSRWWFQTGLTAGTNTFTAKYAVSSGTGTFQYRSLHVIPI